MDKNGGVIRDPSSGDLIAYVYYSPYRSQEKGWLIVTVADRDKALAPIIKQKKLCLRLE